MQTFFSLNKVLPLKSAGELTYHQQFSEIKYALIINFLSEYKHLFRQEWQRRKALPV